jgi:hypothetical protein
MRPPRLAEWLLRRSMRDEEHAAILGDLHEEFQERVAAGPLAACRWYWRQTLMSLAPNFRRRMAVLDGQLPGKDRAMTSAGQDFRFALRLLRRRPLITTAAVLSLAVGVGLPVGVFSLLEAAVIRPLPLTNPDELRVVLEQRERSTNHNFTYPGFAAFRETQKNFTDLVAYTAVEVALERAGGTDMVPGEIVSGGYFSTLGPRVAIGRGLTDADMAPGAPDVVVLSFAEWERLFGGDAQPGGRSVRLNGRDFAVVGVTGPAFRGMQLGRDVRFWAPL